MELLYPINLVGFEEDETSGDVVTRFGEFLGVWTFVRNDAEDRGVFTFTPDGSDAPLFVQTANSLESGLMVGRALSDFCSEIRDWHDESDLVQGAES
ncbi:hypothetical protein [Pseudooceanicola nitratireducens]|uniref:hypothetical protein n=1 Tax=Pseudooceanicola nitratireducens TaxID=517719 RepID=UPI0023F41886|nr:hypothetical protein [Pseudooceanicola nitratireducens]